MHYHKSILYRLVVSFRGKPAVVFLSDHVIANKLYVAIHFFESGKMHLSAVPVGIFKSFFHIGIPDDYQSFLRREPAGFLETVRRGFLSADIFASENHIYGGGQRHAIQRPVSLFAGQVLIDPGDSL